MTFQERLRQQVKAKEFFGREAELALFRDLIGQKEPEWLIMLVHGLGGVGKSWLLEQWKQEARKRELAACCVSEEQRTVDKVLKKFRDDLAEQKFDFSGFDKAYGKFKELKSEAEKTLGEWEDRQGEGMAMAGRITGKSLAVITRLFTPAGELLKLFGGEEKLQETFASGFAFLRKKFKGREDLDFLENPLLHLTRSFIEDLNKICKEKKVILFFDTYEYLSDFCDSWLTAIFFKQNLSSQILFIFAGRETFSPLWQDYHPLARQIPLEVFTDDEAHDYLKEKEITAPSIVEDIIATSGRLPVFMAMLTTQAATAVPGSPGARRQVIERFLKWIPEDDRLKRRGVIRLAFPRFFNKDVVKALTATPEEAEKLFGWLTGLPFIKEDHRGWKYHDLVRRQIRGYKCHESPQEYKELHEKMFEWYKAHPEEGFQAERLYHLTHVDSERGIQMGLGEILGAWVDGENIKDFNSDISGVFRQVDRDGKSQENCFEKWLKYNNLLSKENPEAQDILTKLASNHELTASAWGGAYLILGNLHSKLDKNAEAEAAYLKAIEVKPDYAEAYYNLGSLLDELDKNAEAEAAYRKAIEIKPDYASTYYNLGILYGKLDKNAEAEAAYRKAIEIKPDHASAYNNLGNLLDELDKNAEAEAAFRKAIEIKPDDASAYYNLACLHSLKNEPIPAINWLKKAIALDPQNRKMAQTDPDFDPIRREPAFQELVEKE